MKSVSNQPAERRRRGRPSALTDRVASLSVGEDAFVGAISAEEQGRILHALKQHAQYRRRRHGTGYSIKKGPFDMDGKLVRGVRITRTK